jgi:catechol 2,3-dioxygenase-like lactoylglutathione lyase family enzyme
MDQGAGDLRLGSVVINVRDMNRAVRFWTGALGYVQREQEWDPEFIMLLDPDRRRLPICLQLTSAPAPAPVRLHLDLYPSEQAHHVDRLAGQGRHACKSGLTRRTRSLLSCATPTATSSA